MKLARELTLFLVLGMCAVLALDALVSIRRELNLYEADTFHDEHVTGRAMAIAVSRLLVYSWPGNVRELRNSMERAVALTRYEQITVVDLPERIRERRRARFVTPDDPAELLPLEEVERRYIMTVLEAVGGNKTLAARVLGLDRKTLYRKLERVTHLEAEASDEPR